MYEIDVLIDYNWKYLTECGSISQVINVIKAVRAKHNYSVRVLENGKFMEFVHNTPNAIECFEEKYSEENIKRRKRK